MKTINLNVIDKIMNPMIIVGTVTEKMKLYKKDKSLESNDEPKIKLTRMLERDKKR